MDEPAEDTESVLAAYRERKRKALEAKAQEGPVPSPMAPPAPPAAPPAQDGPAPPPGHYTFAPHPPGPHDAPPGAGVHPPATPHASHPASPVAVPSSSATNPLPHSPHVLHEAPGHAHQTQALEVARPSALGSAPGATLSALGPALRLSDVLLKDAKVSVKGSPGLRAAGTLLVLLGLAGIVLDARAKALGAPVPEYLLAGLGLALAGCILVVVGLNYPRNRRLAVRLAASQRDEWRRVQAESGRLAWTARLGLAATVAGLAILAGAYTVRSMPLLALGACVTAGGAIALLVAQVRRGLARRLYVQTLVLSGLEASGLGASAPDERVQPVILALDRLLGALPESEVQSFLASPQAQAYLELVDEATRSKRGP